MEMSGNFEWTQMWQPCGWMDVCMYVCMYVCSLVRQFLVRQLSNRKINHILTYTKEFFLTVDLA